jgi:hypothetical protein
MLATGLCNLHRETKTMSDWKDPTQVILEQQERIAELKAKLDRVRKCPEYICAFRDIGKIGGAFRKRDVLRAIGDEDDE